MCRLNDENCSPESIVSNHSLLKALKGRFILAQCEALGKSYGSDRTALKGRNTYFALTGLKDNTLVFLILPSALRWAKIERPLGAIMSHYRRFNFLLGLFTPDQLFKSIQKISKK